MTCERTNILSNDNDNDNDIHTRCITYYESPSCTIVQWVKHTVIIHQR